MMREDVLAVIDEPAVSGVYDGACAARARIRLAKKLVLATAGHAGYPAPSQTSTDCNAQRFAQRRQRPIRCRRRRQWPGGPDNLRKRFDPWFENPQFSLETTFHRHFPGRDDVVRLLIDNIQLALFERLVTGKHSFMSRGGVIHA